MLTAIRAMAEAAEADAADADRLTPCWRSVLEAGDDAVARTQEHAAGAAPGAAWSTPARPGWSSTCGARSRACARERPAAVGALAAGAAAEPRLDAPAAVAVSLLHELPGGGRRASTASCWSRCWIRSATRCWWSGSRRSLKVHLHTDDPGAAISLGVGEGTVADVEVADMRVAGARPHAAAAGGRRRRRRPRAGWWRSPTETALPPPTAPRRPASSWWPAGSPPIPAPGRSPMRSRRRPPRACWCCPTTATWCWRPRTPPRLAGRPAAVVPTLSPAAGLVLAERFDPGRRAGRERGRARAAERDASLRRGGGGRPRRPDGRRRRHRRAVPGAGRGPPAIVTRRGRVGRRRGAARPRPGGGRADGPDGRGGAA